MDLYGLIRYFNGDSTAKESAEVERWLENDTDGSRLALYKDARKIFEATLMQPAPVAANQRRIASNWRRIASGAIGIAAAFALVFISVRAGREGMQREIQSLSENVRVPAGRTLEPTLEDGTRVWLNSDSEISYPKIFGNKSRRLELIHGEVLLEVSKDEQRPFTVKTPTADIKVYGTRFSVLYDPEKGIFETSLFRGSIGVTPADGSHGEYRLKSGQSLSACSDGTWTLGSIDTETGAADWIDGLVNIAGSDFRILMERLEKAFGTTIIIQRKDLPEYDISRGRVRVVDGIDHALDVIELAADFKYKHDYNTDTIIIK